MIILVSVLTVLPWGHIRSDDAKGKEEPKPEESHVYSNDDLEERYGRPAPTGSRNGKGRLSSSGGSDKKDGDRQIEAALAAAAALFQDKAIQAAGGATIWHRIRTCRYTGRYNLGSRKKDTLSAVLHYECDGYNKDTERNFRTRVTWPVRLQWNGAGWTVKQSGH